MMSIGTRILVLSSALALVVAAPNLAQAQQLRAGGQVGALGFGTSSKIGYGVFLTIAPYETMGFALDATFADGYFSSSPALLLYTPTTEEIRAGFLLGGGFYKFTRSSVKFGLNAGVTGDFLLTPQLAVGAQLRYHEIFDSENAWNVFLTLSYAFGGKSGSGWDW